VDFGGIDHLIDNYYICRMGIVFKSRIETILTQSGQPVRINAYKEFNEFIKDSGNTDFARHYSLFKNQTGVYKFNTLNRCQYIGYSQNLFDRVRRSYFNNCFGFDYIEFQYILCDTQIEAMNIESYYIKTLQPYKNIAGKVNILINEDIKILPLCNPMLINFNEWYFNK